MSIKPFSEIVNENKQAEETIKPFVDKAQGGVEIKEKSFKDNKQVVEQQTVITKTIGFLGSAQGVLSVFILFVLTALLVDTLQTIQGLFESASLLDTLYLIALVALLSALGIVSYQNYQQIRMLKSASKTQILFQQQKEQSDKKIIPMTLNLLRSYELRDDEKLKQKANLLRGRISSSHDYKEIYKELDEEVVEIIDVQVQNTIKSAATQAAVSTAISPLALLDSGIIVWRSVLLTKEIAQLYGFKPGWLSTMMLLKKGAFNVFFAGATELAMEYVNEAGESSLISKVSVSAGQGVTNGVLLARLGYGVMQACRPLPTRVKRASFLRSMMGFMKEKILDRQDEVANSS